MVARYLLVSVSSGVLFAVLDGLVNGNPLARRLLSLFEPISRTQFNVVAAALIDLLYGFALTGLYLLLYDSLPGTTGWLKGLTFALLLWFLRVVMQSLGQWLMFDMPGLTLAYLLAAGLLEMLILGLFYGLTLKPNG